MDTWKKKHSWKILELGVWCLSVTQVSGRVAGTAVTTDNRAQPRPLE